MKWRKTVQYLKELREYINQLTLYSAALSFYTIFALVPLVLIVLTIFSATPFFKELYSKLEEFLAANLLPSNKDVILHYIQKFLRNSGKMGVMGGIYIIFTSVLFFDNYETILQRIFPRFEKRSLWERIKLYWTMLTLFPFLFIGVLYLSIKLQLFLDKHTFTAWIKLAVIIPFITIWGSFYLVYKLTLNSTANLAVALSAFIASVAFFISKTVFVYYTFINKTYASLYGSIALLLFLFLWIYVNWIIYLGGIYLIRLFEWALPLYHRRKKSPTPPPYYPLLP
jgi:membrane protein